MKVIWLTIFTLLLAFKPLSAGFPTNFIKMCVKQSKVKSIDLALFYGTDFKEASKPAKCYITCLLESVGLIEGRQVNSKLLEHADTSDPRIAFLSDLLQNCGNITAEGECEIGLKMFKCFVKFGARRMPRPADELVKEALPTD